MNADAFQAYVGMDVGTAKPRDRARYRLLDIKRPDEAYGVGEFCVRAAAALAEIRGRGRSAVVVGGTGQYVRALFGEYRDLMPEPDPALRARYASRLAGEGLPALAAELARRAPEVAAATALDNPVRVTRALERLDDPRPPLAFAVPYVRRLKLGLDVGKSENDARIATRNAEMMHNGWVEEVRRLRDAGYGPGDPGFRAIGYRTVARLLDGDLAPESAVQEIVQETVAYAKRQRTWLRSEPGIRTFASQADVPLGEALRLIDADLF